MSKALLAAIFVTASFAASAAAQGVSTAPPPVESLTCEQMQAEMMTAGQQMNAQLDPTFSTEAQAMYAEAQQRQRSAMTQGMAMGAVCAVPGVGMACAAAQQAQAAQGQRDAAANRDRMQAQMDRLNAAMDGIDQQRMQAISDRWENQHCQAAESAPAQ